MSLRPEPELQLSRFDRGLSRLWESEQPIRPHDLALLGSLVEQDLLRWPAAPPGFGSGWFVDGFDRRPIVLPTSVRHQRIESEAQALGRNPRREIEARLQESASEVELLPMRRRDRGARRRLATLIRGSAFAIRDAGRRQVIPPLHTSPLSRASLNAPEVMSTLGSPLARDLISQPQGPSRVAQVMGAWLQRLDALEDDALASVLGSDRAPWLRPPIDLRGSISAPPDRQEALRRSVPAPKRRANDRPPPPASPRTPTSGPHWVSQPRWNPIRSAIAFRWYAGIAEVALLASAEHRLSHEAVMNALGGIGRAALAHDESPLEDLSYETALARWMDWSIRTEQEELIGVLQVAWLQHAAERLGRPRPLGGESPSDFARTVTWTRERITAARQVATPASRFRDGLVAEHMERVVVGSTHIRLEWAKQEIADSLTADPPHLPDLSLYLDQLIDGSQSVASDDPSDAQRELYAFAARAILDAKDVSRFAHATGLPPGYAAQADPPVRTVIQVAKHWARLGETSLLLGAEWRNEVTAPRSEHPELSTDIAAALAEENGDPLILAAAIANREAPENRSVGPEIVGTLSVESPSPIDPSRIELETEPYRWPEIADLALATRSEWLKAWLYHQTATTLRQPTASFPHQALAWLIAYRMSYRTQTHDPSPWQPLRAQSPRGHAPETSSPRYPMPPSSPEWLWVRSGIMPLIRDDAGRMARLIRRAVTDPGLKSDCENLQTLARDQSTRARPLIASRARLLTQTVYREPEAFQKLASQYGA